MCFFAGHSARFASIPFAAGGTALATAAAGRRVTVIHAYQYERACRVAKVGIGRDER